MDDNKYNHLSDIDISDIATLQAVIVDLMDGKYNEGDNDTGLSNKRFMEIVEIKDRLVNLNN